MTPAGKLVIAQVGGGASALELLPAMVESGVGAVYLAEPDAQVRAETARPWGIVKRETGDWRELLAADEVDAVCLALPAEACAEVASLALQAGKHVLLPAPPVGSLEEWDALARAASAAGKLLLVRAEQSAHPVLDKVAELIAAGEPGALSALAIVALEAAPRQDLLGAAYERVAVAQRFLGLVVEVSAALTPSSAGRLGALAATLRHAGGGLSSLTLVQGPAELRPLEERRLLAAEATLLARDDPEDELPLVATHGQDWLPIPVRVPLYIRPWMRRRMLEQMVAAMAGKAEPVFTASQARAALATVAALREAAAGGGLVRLS